MTGAPEVAERALPAVPPHAAAAELERALGEADMTCTVEPRERLAVIVMAPAVAAVLTDDATRELIVRLAARHGFTHLALELPGAGTAVARTAGAGDDSASLPRP